MTATARDQNDMPDVPKMDFVGALAEIWSVLNYAAYHLAYVRVYLETAALQTHVDDWGKFEQDMRNMAQVDLLICRAHLAALFWQLDHMFEALRAAVTRGQREQPTEKYFWAYEKQLNELEERPIRRQIGAYRNKAHEITAIIGQTWDKKGGKFIRHFLPVIAGLEENEPLDINEQLQQFFEFVANVWLSFAPSELKNKFPNSFEFPVTVPYSYIGHDVPPEVLGAQQFVVMIQAYERADVAGEESKTSLTNITGRPASR
jgi:hypothetical protein